MCIIFSALDKEADRFSDVAFLISNHFKKERRGKEGEAGHDVLYSELGGR